MDEDITNQIEYDGLFLATNKSTADKVTVRVEGRLETANSIHFLDYMTNLIESSFPGGELILEISELYYVSSTGIGAFTTILVNCKKKSIKFFIKDIQPKVLSVLELLGFSSFFNFL